MKAWKKKEIDIVDKIIPPFEMSAGSLLQFRMRVKIGRYKSKGVDKFLEVNVDILVNKILEI